ncbi:NAD(P)-dependent dehydrogenase (short-subunit alcohol dehydrogenase family) [Larkinella arboricola]|uniref:3-oxoacyl-[acyl-carrier-protein] reductase FabG n=1 Tax=Larkinella arboricola TaxID=643671 RepID=A0A327X5Z3_LARAB|nr:SDR family oxidoreductase [Larkinella arboricola]RAK02089.1 NAD(P)-dependent dehydrogenase (short-subunit alcohol dehydrogenase family) [Larkinella arboricola]
MQKTILITGSSRGIGASTARLAALQGYQVMVNYITNQQAALKIVDDINQNGGKASCQQADVSSESDVVALFQTIDRQLGPLTALVNNAGILEHQMRVEQMDVERWQRVLASNVLSCFLCSREAIHRMSQKRGGAGGSIVNVSSIAARTGSPGEYVDYAASKGAVDAFTLGLAKEVADEGIRVNAVRPGFIYTDIHASGGEPNRVDRLKDSLPMKRGGTPDEVAHAILWLLSDEASYCTGTFLDLTGGR